MAIAQHEIRIDGPAFLNVKQPGNGAVLRQKRVTIVELIGDDRVKVQGEDGRASIVARTELAPDRRWLAQQKEQQAKAPELRLVDAPKPGALSASLAERAAARSKAPPTHSPSGKRLPPSAIRLAVVRQLRGLSFLAAAEATGCSIQTIKQGETTPRQLRNGTLEKLARGYQVHVDLLNPDVALPTELPAWQGKSAKKAKKAAPAATATTPAPAKPAATTATPASAMDFDAWRALTTATHKRVTKACDELVDKIHTHEGEIATLRSQLAARQSERRTLERALT